VSEDKRATARELANQHLAQNDPLGWFEKLYALADSNPTLIPWADLAPNPNLLSWLNKQTVAGSGKKALKIGCGLGDDAEELSRRGFETTAFDISLTAISWCHKRFPHTRVQYVVENLFNAPDCWISGFDFVVEAYTLQVLPEDLQRNAIRIISEFVKPGGTLLVLTRGRDKDDPAGKMPWPLTHDTLSRFKGCGLAESLFEDYMDDEQPPVRRFRVSYIKKQYCDFSLPTAGR
jgi:SAM-dependent methyltransferase